MKTQSLAARQERLQAKIIQALTEEGFNLTADVAQRVDHFVSCLPEWPDTGRVPAILCWLEDLRAHATMHVSPAPLSNLKRWRLDPATGIISHDSNQFFRVEGIQVHSADEREQTVWDQPIIYQPEMGILGIARKKINGVWHYLLQAKAEPGNIGKLQLSPTLQSTWSNLKQAHGGQKPLFADYFQQPSPGQVVYATHQTEDGSRFYQKNNLNMIIEVEPDELTDIPDHFLWLTMADIKQLLKQSNTVNLYVRSIISPL